MKDVITSRLQLFLAKIAGRSVSESTLTPPVVSNMEEKLLDEIAGRLDTIEGTIEGASPSGSSGEVFIITCDYETWQLDKTWQEIFDALAANKICIIKEVGNEPGYPLIEYEFVTSAHTSDGASKPYIVESLRSGNNSVSNSQWSASSPDDIPS